MNAEELLKYLRKCVEDLNIKEFKVLITPTMYDPNELQNDVSIGILEEVKGGYIPRFTINVKDVEAIRLIEKNKS